MKENITKILFMAMLLILTTSCDDSPQPPPPPPPPMPGSMLPFLSATYAIGPDIYLKETTNINSSAVFNDAVSPTRHTLVTSASPGSRPATTLHKGSQWLAWLEGNTIYAKALWWGPGNVRTVFEGGADTPTSPAIASYNDQLVVVWGVGDSLYSSHSQFGVEWQPPVAKRFVGAVVNNPTLAVHNNTLYTGVAFGASLFTVSIKSDFSWGPNFPAMTVGSPIIPEVTLASNGDQMSMGYASGNQLFVIHSATGYNNWSSPSEIDSSPLFPAPPALAYYNNYLYAVYPTSARLLMRRSADGINWATPRFVVDANASGNLPAASLVSSDYSIAAPQPQVVVLNDSGIPAANTLNLIFISDGYLQSEMGDFQQLIDRIANTFRIVNPFSKHLDKYNIYRIDLPSREKGSDASPLMAAAVRQGVLTPIGFQSPVPGFQPRYTDTSLGSHYRSCWGSNHHNSDITQTKSSPNNANTPQCDAAEDLQNPHDAMTQQKAIHLFGYYAYDLVQQLIPGIDPSRDILYAVVNHIPEDGNTDKASYNPVVSTPDFAEGLGNVHEIAHFTSSLGDEDFSVCSGGVATDCNLDPNKTVNANLSDANHKWAHFFVSEGRPGDSILADPVSRPPSWNTFWDPAVTNASGIFNTGLWATNGVSDDWSGTGETIVYGPAQQCLMNHTGSNSHFCPVCTEEMTKEIFDRAGVPFVDNDYHNVYNQVFIEYEHGQTWLANYPYPKSGFININGTNVSENDFTCHVVREQELCSVNVTSYINNGTNSLIFQQQPGVTRGLSLLSLQVVNNNGAPLALFPITDVSTIGSAYYLADYNWSMATGNLEFEFTAQLTP